MRKLLYGVLYAAVSLFLVYVLSMTLAGWFEDWLCNPLTKIIQGGLLR